LKSLFLLVPLLIFPAGFNPYFIKFFIVSVAVFIFLFKKKFSGTKIPLQENSLHIFVFIFILFFSFLNADNKRVCLLNFSKISPFFILCFLFDEREKLKNWLGISVLITSVIGILQKIGFISNLIPDPFSSRIYATFGNPNFFASFLFLSFPFFAGWCERKKLNALVLLPYLCILLTETFGTILSITVLFIFYAKKKNFLRYLLPLHLVVLILGGMFFDLSSKKSSVEERIFKWRVGIEIFKENPFLGTGTGGVKTNFAIFQAKVKKRLNLPSTSESKIHNDWIQLLAETGILGFVSFLILLIYSLLKNRDAEAKLSLMAFIFDAMTNFPLELPSSLLIFSFALSFTKAKKQKLHPLIFLLVSGGVLFFSSKEFIADYFRKRGIYEYSKNRIEKAICFLKKAHKISPTSGKTAYNLGMLFVIKKDYMEAIHFFKESIKIRNYGEVYNDLGNAYYLKGDIKRAISSWEKAIELGIPQKEQLKKNIQHLKKNDK